MVIHSGVSDGKILTNSSRNNKRIKLRHTRHLIKKIHMMGIMDKYLRKTCIMREAILKEMTITKKAMDSKNSNKIMDMGRKEKDFKAVTRRHQ